MASLAWSVSLLLTLVWSGAAVTLRHTLESVTGTSRPTLLVVLYVAVVVLLHEIGALALGYYGGFVLDRRYGLSTQTARHWLADQGKSVLLTFMLGAAAAALI